MIEYLQLHAGETASLVTAFLWTITALVFESASLKVGSLPVNIIRLIFGLIFLSVFTYFYRGYFFPAGASVSNWIWLSVSGLIGFVFGDLFLFKSFTMIGSRFAMLIMSLVPPMTAFLGWLFLNERLTAFNFLGMILTLFGIALAIFNRNKDNQKISLKLSPRGILFAFAGALGQATGLIVSKYGMKDYDPFASAQIRIIAGSIGFGFLIGLSGKSKYVFEAFKNKTAIKRIVIGAFLGLFLGVSLSQLAIKYVETGIASTIMSLVPILIIVPSVIFLKQKVTFWEIVGAIISVGGVTLFFIK